MFLFKQSEGQRASLDGDYPGLSALSYWIGYLEQALSILSEPLLIGCSALAVVDFITGGGLLKIPFFMYLWASVLAIAVTACFIVTWRRALRALALNRYLTALFLALLGVLLGVVDWTAVATQSLQQALNIGFVQALSDLNFSVFWITSIRAAVAISMAVVVAISNHTAVTTAQAPKRKLLIFERVLNFIAPVISDTSAQSPAQSPVNKQQEEKHAARLTVLSVSKDNEPLERVKRALGDNPNCSDRKLGELTHLAPATAKKYRKVVEQVS